MSGLPMRADVGHAFSGGPLHLLCTCDQRTDLRDGHPAMEKAGRKHSLGCVLSDARALSERGGTSIPQAAGRQGGPRSESVTYEASPAYGNTGEWRVLELPGCVEVARFPTPEAAASHALALLEWLAARPDPAHCAPFFVPQLPDDGWRASGDRLFRILDDQLRPERMGL